MYANMGIDVTDANGKVSEHYAWRVDILPKSVKVYTDRNDGGSDYADEGPVLTFKRDAITSIRIMADF